MWGEIAKTVAGPLVGGLFGLGGAKSAAKLSQKQAREQMAFQERMRNTGYQAAAADLEAAGLNRILALGSPAPTPGGAMGQVPNFGESMVSGAQMADGLRTSRGQRALMRDQGTNQVASAKAADAQAKVHEATEKLTDARTRSENARADIQEKLAGAANKTTSGWKGLEDMLFDNLIPRAAEGVNSAKGWISDSLREAQRLRDLRRSRDEEGFIDYGEHDYYDPDDPEFIKRWDQKLKRGY